jgi:hypothetical protein
MTPEPFRARFLHIDGHLGFHAPYLEVPPGEYDQATVLAAFGKSMEVVTGLTAWSERLELSDAFLVNLFGTPYDDMYMIDTVGKAAELSVQLVGHSLPQQLTVGIIEEACLQSLPATIRDEAKRYDASVYIGDAWRITPHKDGLERGVGIINFGQESYQSWYLCSVAYYPPRGAVPVPDWSELWRFEGARDILFAAVSASPLLEWSDPMTDAPPIQVSKILQEFGILGDVTYDNLTIRSETVLSVTVLIKDMDLLAWKNDRPAPIIEVKNNSSEVAHQKVEPTAQPFVSFWDHNGSRMGLVAEGNSRSFYYVTPRKALLERGVFPGLLLFEGQRTGDRYVGTARIFAAPPCGEFPYQVEGPVSSDQETVTMSGNAPRVNDRCEIIGYRPDTLLFTLD